MITQLIFQSYRIKWGLIGLIAFGLTIHLVFPPSADGQEIENQIVAETPTVTPAPPSTPSPTPIAVSMRPETDIVLGDKTASKTKIHTSNLIRAQGSLQALGYTGVKTRIFSSVRLSYPSGYLYIDDSYTDFLKWHEWDQQTMTRYLEENYGYPEKDGTIGRYYINEQGEFVVVPSQAGPGVISYLSFTPYNGAIENLGNIKIWVDGLLVVDEPAEEFLSGRSYHTPGLCRSFSDKWANICYTPIPYKKSIQIAVTGKPSWWHITITDFPQTSADEVSSFDGIFDSSAIEAVNQRLDHPADISGLAGTVISYSQDTPISYHTKTPLTVQHLQITVPKSIVNDFYLAIDNRDGESIELPLYAFWGFGSDREITPYRSLLLGVEDQTEDYFFYANIAIPFSQAGGSITLHKNGDPTPAKMEIVESPLISAAKLNVSYNPGTFLAQGSPDYEIDLTGKNVRVVGMMFRASDFAQDLTFVPDWGANYVESNIGFYERLGGDVWQWRGAWAGIEDFASDANFFQFWNPHPNFMTGGLISTTPDHKNLTVLRIFPGLDGLTGQNGLKLTVEHGAWNANKNNDAQLSYGHTVWYYSE